MSRSWNWRIIEFPDTHKPWADKAFSAQSHPWATNCRKKGCTKQADCNVAYDYITGRRGRVSDNRKPYCRDHAVELVAKKAIEEAKEAL